METSLLFIRKEGRLVPKTSEFLTSGGTLIILELLKQIKCLLTQALHRLRNKTGGLVVPAPVPSSRTALSCLLPAASPVASEALAALPCSLGHFH